MKEEETRRVSGREDAPLLTVSVLVTRDEYMAGIDQLQRKRKNGKATLLMGVGAVLIAAGIAGLFFGKEISLEPTVSFGLLAVGLFLACYPALVSPLLDRAAAAREYDEKESVRLSTIYLFRTETVEIRNSRMEGVLPLSALTDWNETTGIFCLSFGRELNILLPKRLLAENQQASLREILMTQTKRQETRG